MKTKSTNTKDLLVELGIHTGLDIVYYTKDRKKFCKLDEAIDHQKKIYKK